MLKTRIIPVLYIKNGLIVRSEGFSYHQNIGNIINEAKRYNDWDVDELIYIDISREKIYDSGRDDHKIKSYNTIKEIIKAISRVCFMPLTFGGGIESLEDIDLRIRHGADKVTVNTLIFRKPEVVRRASLKYGSQSIVASIDYRIVNNSPRVFVEHGTVLASSSIMDWVKRCEDSGAGEIFLNSIDRDGMSSGYDLGTIAEVCNHTSLPVVACGGASDAFDFLELIQRTSVSGAAAGNLFHFTENSYKRAKRILRDNNSNVR